MVVRVRKWNIRFLASRVPHAFLVCAASVWGGTAYAEDVVKIDVMTRMSGSEKRDLQTIKLGVLGALESALWVDVRTFGEDYSLWVTALRREILDSRVRRTSVTVLLKPPAAVWRDSQEIFGSREIQATFTVLEDDAPLARVEEAVVRYIATGGGRGDFVAATTAGVAKIGNLQLPGGGDLVAEAMERLGPHLGRAPASWEVTEASLIGLEALIALRELIDEHERMREDD